MRICKEKYRLELHWDSLVYHNHSTVELIGARFSGPVLKDSLELKAPDKIELDFTPQLFVLMDSYYIVTLTWAGRNYTSDGDIKLVEATMSNNFLKTLHKFEPGDYIVIDTEKHEESTHAFHLVYASSVVKSSGLVYNYRDK